MGYRAKHGMTNDINEAKLYKTARGARDYPNASCASNLKITVYEINSCTIFGLPCEVK